MRPSHYILDGKRPVPCDDLLAWGMWYSNAEARRVAWTEIGGAAVSTVFLGMDHSFTDEGPPILFETMIFGEAAAGAMEGEMLRYATWEEAEEGHRRVVEMVRLTLVN